MLPNSKFESVYIYIQTYQFKLTDTVELLQSCRNNYIHMNVGVWELLLNCFCRYHLPQVVQLRSQLSPQFHRAHTSEEKTITTATSQVGLAPVWLRNASLEAKYVSMFQLDTLK